MNTYICTAMSLLVTCNYAVLAYLGYISVQRITVFLLLQISAETFFERITSSIAAEFAIVTVRSIKPRPS